jgi:diaminopimelate decarboxylase
MEAFTYRNGRLYAEDIPLSEIARQFGTPCYVYSGKAIEEAWRDFAQAFGHYPHLICYAVKANSNLAILNLLARLGSGFDIVSVGELERVLRAGGDPARVVFAGVGKRIDEMQRALETRIRCFNIESAAELERLNQVAAKMGLSAPVSIRVNPDVDAKTHPYISTGLNQNKFGIAMHDALDIYIQAARMEHIEIRGVSCHIGSQLTSMEPVLNALDRLLGLVDTLERKDIGIEHLDIGGGLGIRYRDETPPSPSAYARAIMARLQDRPYEIIVEPGRAIVGNSGVLLTRIEYLKHTGRREFAIVDAAMNDLVRPALYNSWQDIVPVEPRLAGKPRVYEVVGPICESGDFLGRERMLCVEAGDLLAIRSVGAYGFSMSSTYNSRPRAAEVMIVGDQAYLIRERDSVHDLMAGEAILPS